MKLWLVALLFLGTGEIFAKCSLVRIKGRVVLDKMNEYKIKVVTYEKSNSAISFFMSSDSDALKVAPFLHKMIQFQAILPHPIKNRRAVIKNIDKIKVTIPDPLNMNGDFAKIRNCS